MRRKFKVQSSKFKVIVRAQSRTYLLLSLLLMVFLLLLTTNYQLPTAYAQQSCLPAQSHHPRVTSGLITTPAFSDINNKFGNNSGTCIVDLKAAFAPYKIPSYEDLKSLYYDQFKSSANNQNIYLQPTPNTHPLPSLLQPPTNLNVTCPNLTGSSNIDLSWSPVTRAARYLLRVEHQAINDIYQDDLPATVEADGKVHYSFNPVLDQQYRWWLHAGTGTQAANGYDSNVGNSYVEGGTFTCKTLINKHPSLVGDKTQTDIPMTAGANHIFYIQKTSPTSTDGNLTITNNIPGNQTGVVFVDGNLTIGGPLPSERLPGNTLSDGGNNSGLVFIVQGNVIIDPGVIQINAVIIASGTIYTAGAGCTLAGNLGTNSQLVINGSLISLTEANKIQFCRKLADPDNDNTPAEIINNQPKYLVILKDLFADTLQKWSEIQ